MKPDTNTIRVSVKWHLLTRAEIQPSYEIPAGTVIGDFLPSVLSGLHPEEVVVVFNGQPCTMADIIEQNGTIELIPMLCGG